jgi:hypothetical protein
MDNKITVRITEKYGVRRVYPVCDRAKIFASIAKDVTLTDATMKLVKQLGYDIVPTEISFNFFED